MRYGVASRLPGKTLQAGTTRTASNNSLNNININKQQQQRERPNSAALVTPRGSVIPQKSYRGDDDDLESNNNDISDYNDHNNSYSHNNTGGGGGGGGSRASSVGRGNANINSNTQHYSSSVARSNTPSSMNMFNMVRSSGYGYGASSNSGNSPAVPKSTHAALDEFSKPTAAAEARNASASVLVERLRNIVSKHEERHAGVGSGSSNSNNNNNNNANSRQFEALKQHRANSSVIMQGDLDSENNSSQNIVVTRVVPNESKLYQSNSRIMIGSYLDDSSNNTTPATSAPGSAMKPGRNQENWQGGMEYDDDHNDDDEESDDESDDEVDQEKKSRKTSVSPQRPPLPQSPGTTPNPRLSPQQQQNSPTIKSSGFSPTMVTRQIGGFSWCRDWTRRGMRPDEVVFNEQCRVACDATCHVEPRGLDIWHHVALKQKTAHTQSASLAATARGSASEASKKNSDATSSASSTTGSFMCRRCGIPVFPATAMTYPIPRAGHITFTHRFGRTTEAELCPQESKIIMKCAKCHGFLADIYDVQSRTMPPLFRASSWCLWYDADMHVPENIGETLGPYIEEVEDAMDESELQEMLDKVDPLTKAEDFF